MKHALVTGASGFIGSHLVTRLEAAGWRVTALGRDWQRVPFDGVDAVYHLAGLAHSGAQGADRATLVAVNADTTAILFRHCGAHQVKRFVWLSSIKVLGDASAEPLTVTAPYNPGDDYAASKVAAEEALLSAATGSTQLRIVRPPLVYGPNVRANFLALLKWSLSGWPLPLASAQAPRAWLGVNNLCHFLQQLGEYDESPSQRIWHVHDGPQSSVAQMVAQIREVAGQSPRLWSVRPDLALQIGRWLGREEQLRRLFLPLCVNMEDTLQLLGWQPPHTQLEELAKAVAWFRS